MFMPGKTSEMFKELCQIAENASIYDDEFHMGKLRGAVAMLKVIGADCNILLKNGHLLSVDMCFDAWRCSATFNHGLRDYTICVDYKENKR